MKTRAVLILAAGVAAVALLGWLLLSGGRPGPSGYATAPAEVIPTPTPAPVQRVTLLFVAGDGLLHPELREVPLPVEVDERARVVVRELLVGPGPEAELATIFPYPAELLGLYVDRDHNAFIDLTAPPEPLAGSQTEIMLAYGVINSVLLNCPELSAVQLLFSGHEVPSLTGHLDLSRPLPLNKRFVAGL